VLQVSHKERRGQAGLDIVKEGLLSHGRDGVEVAKSQSEQTITVGVGDELGRDLLGSLNGLRSIGHTADRNGISVDDTAGAGSILANSQVSELRQ
jgi:hypothetical protein